MKDTHSRLTRDSIFSDNEQKFCYIIIANGLIRLEVRIMSAFNEPDHGALTLRKGLCH